MDRLFLFAVACVSQVGCQLPYAPLGTPSTRVPPPPTGVIGDGAYYTEPLGRNSQGFNGPPSITSNIPPLRGPGEEINYVGPWRYWESARDRSLVSRDLRDPRALQAADGRRSLSSAGVRLASADIPPDLRDRTVPATQSTDPNSNLTRNDRLDWGSPYRSSSFATGSSTPTDTSFRQRQAYANTSPRNVAATPSQVTGSSYRAPRPLPQVAASAPIPSAPVRVRGFSGSSERREVAVAQEFYDFDGGVRQASVGTPGQR